MRFPVAILLILVGLLPGPATTQTPDRVFPEPIDSTDFITHGPAYAPERFKKGMLALQEAFPRWIEFTTVREELGTDLAVSTGEDGVPAWHPEDTGDGQDFQVVSVTDRTVPDADKEFALFMVSHAAEWCGRESMPRFFEDLVRWADGDPSHLLDAGVGTRGEDRLEATVAEVLTRTKLIFVDVAPDGWVAGDRNHTNLAALNMRSYSQYNGAGINGNRVAYELGWVFPDDPVIRSIGYSTLTQPEGIAPTLYLKGLRDRVLRGRPFATAMDFHGPVPVGANLIMEGYADPAKNDRILDLAERIDEKSYDVLAEYLGEPVVALHKAQGDTIEEARRLLFEQYNTLLGPVDEKALYLTTHWSEHATPWEHIDYTVTSSWGGWAVSPAGLGADGFSHEIPCEVQSEIYDPPAIQLFVDNVRAMAETMVVHAAHRRDREVVRRYELGDRIGFVDSGRRVTDADGNASPPPGGVRNPLVGVVQQAPYDVSPTEWYRDLRSVTNTDVIELSPDDLAGDLAGFATIAVTDHTDADPAALRAFAEAGGSVVLTDGALALLPRLVDVPEDAVERRFAYVGYVDRIDDHPWWDGTYARGRQTYGPVGLGLPLLMERDQYWNCGYGPREGTVPFGSVCEESITQNSSPIWTVDRDAWESLGGVTAATADAPTDRKGSFEGTRTDETALGTLDVGKGRIVIFGSVLPTPSEDHPHWKGLAPYTVTNTGQHLLTRALTWHRASAAQAAAVDPADVVQPEKPRILPATGIPARPLSGLAALLAAVVGAFAARRRR
jgi:hypothetical protein